MGSVSVGVCKLVQVPLALGSYVLASLPPACRLLSGACCFVLGREPSLETRYVGSWGWERG